MVRLTHLFLVNCHHGGFWDLFLYFVGLYIATDQNCQFISLFPYELLLFVNNSALLYVEHLLGMLSVWGTISNVEFFSCWILIYLYILT